jgi:hypothetical protein
MEEENRADDFCSSTFVFWIWCILVCEYGANAFENAAADDNIIKLSFMVVLDRIEIEADVFNRFDVVLKKTQSRVPSSEFQVESKILKKIFGVSNNETIPTLQGLPASQPFFFRLFQEHNHHLCSPFSLTCYSTTLPVWTNTTQTQNHARRKVLFLLLTMLPRTRNCFCS